MNAYKAYFDRQQVSRETHDKLLALGDEAPAKKKHSPRLQWGTLAACAALILGVGFYAMRQTGLYLDSTNPNLTIGAIQTTQPTELDDTDTPAPVESQPPALDSSKQPAPRAADIPYTDLTHSPELAASLAWPQGGFSVELTQGQIQTLLWGPEGKPAGLNPKVDSGDFPYLLPWGDYTVTGTANYDGEGNLWMLTLRGEHGEDDFTLNLCHGRIPPTCLVDPDRAGVEVNGVPVTAWFRCYDCNGDKVKDYICGSEFMAGDIGLRFENMGSPLRSEYNGQTDMAAGGAMEFNALFVTYALNGGLYPDELLTCGDIPAWREENFSTLAAAREETDFAPYLPKTAPVSGWEFNSGLNYQEGNYNYLWVSWTRMYDNIEVNVYLPEDPNGYPNNKTPVDVNLPESYDYRLYTLPLSESVPREYVLDFYSVTFRAEDLSLEVVKARETGHDTGGSSFRFHVLHENGVVVSYSCDGMTAEEVWALVEATL